jgi:hypothetical protein
MAETRQKVNKSVLKILILLVEIFGNVLSGLQEN